MVVKLRLTGARLWLLAFLGFFLLHAGWAFAAPYNGPPDEEQHAMRAAAVMHGELIGPPTNFQVVPNSLYRPFCFSQLVNTPANCVAEPGGDQTMAPHYISEAKFNPVYYAVTGWPIGIWPSWRGIMLARLLTGAIMAALLACALVAAVRWTRHRALVAGLVVAATPMIASLGGSINPNGVEIAAAVALFAALISVIHEQRQGINRAAVALAGVSASVLVTPRFSGVLWLAVIFGAMLIPSSWARLRELARSRTVRRWSAVIVLATIASGVWTMVANTAGTGNVKGTSTASQIIKTAVLDMWPNVINQMVGVMGWAETLMPRLIYVAWFMAAGLLLLGALVMGKRVDRWRMLALGLGTFVPFLAVEVLLVNQIGWFNQGRYFLPGAVGLPLLGAHILARRGINAEQMRAMTRIFAVILLPIQLVCLAYTMCRWQSGLRILNPFKGTWIPPYGVVLPLVAGTLGVIVLFIVYWRASRIPVAVPAEPVTEEPVTELVQTVSA
jgi:hypothetical protein